MILRSSFWSHKGWEDFEGLYISSGIRLLTGIDRFDSTSCMQRVEHKPSKWAMGGNTTNDVPKILTGPLTRCALWQVLVEGPNPKKSNEAVGRNSQNKLVFFPGNGLQLKGALVDVCIDYVHAYTLFGHLAA